MTVLFWKRYTSNPTRTTILTSYAPTTAIPFPAVTICNINRIMVSKVEKYMETLKLNDSEKSTIRNAFPQLLSFTHPNARGYNMTELTVLQDVLERNGYSNTTVVMEEISQDCQQMLMYCMWNKKNISCPQHFKKSISYDGVCCSFNYRVGEESSVLYNPFSGLGTGLRVLLNPMFQPVQYSSLYSSGFKVLVHYPTEYIGPHSDSKIVAVGRMSFLEVAGTKMICSEDVKSLAIGQRECIYADERKLKYFREHSDSNCLIECEHRLYLRYCGCVPFYLSFTDKPICNISKIPCLHTMRSDKTVSKRMQSCKCLPECEDIFYNVLSTSTTMKYNDSMSMMSLGGTPIIEGSVLLNVFFLTNTQTILLRDTITSTIYLLSSFGGVYSLFMGCSLITIIEIIYYCCFRFVLNMKGFGRVDTIVEYKGKDKVASKQKPVTLGNYPSLQFQQFYYNNVFLP